MSQTSAAQLLTSEVRFNGKPTLSTVTPVTTLTVQSVAGTATGDTALSVTPAEASAGCKYVWSYGKIAPEATVGQVLTGWNDFVPGDYTIPSGDNVVVAMVNTATSVVVATGKTTVTTKE